MEIINGQTVFQDTHFVIGDYEQGPYRAIRKLDIQVAELDRTLPKPDDPRHKEIKARLDNYAALREKILACRPQEYWDAGFEAAEGEYWVNTLARKVALENMLNGRPAIETMGAVLSLPADLQPKVMLEARSQLSGLKTLALPLLGQARE